MVTLRDFALDNNQFLSTLYTRAQWPFIPQWLFTLYRVLIALYFLVWQGITIFAVGRLCGNAWKYFIYLTSWSFSVETLYLLIALASIILKKRSFPGIGLLHQLQWLFFNIASALSMLNMAAFWTLVFPMMTVPMTTLDLLINLHVHFLCALVMLLELFIVRLHVRRVHVWQVVLVMLLYLLFNVLYVVAFDGTDLWGNDYVYPLNDWKRAPMTSVLICLVTLPVCLFIWFGVIYGGYRARRAVFKHYWPHASEYDSVYVSTRQQQQESKAVDERVPELSPMMVTVVS